MHWNLFRHVQTHENTSKSFFCSGVTFYTDTFLVYDLDRKDGSRATFYSLLLGLYQLPVLSYCHFIEKYRFFLYFYQSDLNLYQMKGLAILIPKLYGMIGLSCLVTEIWPFEIYYLPWTNQLPCQIFEMAISPLFLDRF